MKSFVGILLLCALYVSAIQIAPQGGCKQLTGWTPSYPDLGDFSQHTNQSVEDNWVMCNLHDDSGNQYGLNAFQVRIDYAPVYAQQLSGLAAFGPQMAAAVEAILLCGCTPGPCLSQAVLNVAATASAISGFLIGSGNPYSVAVGELLASYIPVIQAQGVALANSPLNRWPQSIGYAIGIVNPQLNANEHLDYEASAYDGQYDATVFQVPGVAEILESPGAFSYNQDRHDSHRFRATGSVASDFVSGSTLAYNLQLRDRYGPLLWGPNSNGFFGIQLSSGQTDYWTQSDQPWIEATGTIAVGGNEIEVSGACWNSRQWHTSPSLSGATTGPYVWIPLTTADGIVLQLAVYYKDASYDPATSAGGGNIAYPVCEGDVGYNANNAYIAEIHGKKCHAGPMQSIKDGEFSFVLSEPWPSTHNTGNTYWRTVHVQSSKWQFDFVVRGMVAANEYDWATAPTTAYSEAPATVTGTIGGKAVNAVFASIEHLKTG